MKASCLLTFTGILCLGSAALAQENADALKQRVRLLAQSMTPDDYAFTRTVRNDVTAGGNNEQTVNIERYDPTKPAEARWSLVSVNGAPPSADALKRFRKEVRKRRMSGYDRLANYFGAPATTSTDADGRTVFRFSSLPKGSIDMMDIDLSRNASAELVMSDGDGTPFAEQVHLSVKPIRLLLVMKLNRYEATSRFAVGPQGKPLLVEQTAELSGSALGFEGSMRSVATYSDYRAVGVER